MRIRSPNPFTTVRSEGALLPPDVLRRILDADQSLKGLTPADYHLPGREKLGEAISRSWSRLMGAWEAFQGALARLPQTDPATSVTRERWLLPLFQELNFGRLLTTGAIELDGRTYPVSHLWQATPIHLVGAGLPLDRRTKGVAGAARTTPHGLVQELLNRSADYRWGIVSNGLRLRVLRDSASLTRQAYVEFDLEGMMRGRVYSDFSLLWLLCHQSRFEQEDGRPPWLERWAQAARTEGVRALDTLRDGVRQAIEALGRGFLGQPANAALKDALRSGALSTDDYYRQLLRLVYRLIFLFVAEDRGLLFDPEAAEQARRRYADYYSTARLRRLAGRRRGTRHPDLYEGLKLVMAALGDDAGCPPLALPCLGSFLWSPPATEALNGCVLSNADLLEAVRALAFVRDARFRRPVDYRNMGAEELGSVYESLLELHPEVQADAASFELVTASGHERKTTGSYYTPTSLITVLLDSALDPVLDEAARKPDPEAAILDLKVLDPAAGSGHFLVASAHRIAHRLAQARTGDEEPSPDALRAALRDVIGRCLYAVDVNPMAVELCKVSLWMEAMDPGRPLSFLDHHIVCGNSLLGATPALLEEGIPDEAFKALEGDDRAIVKELKKRNREERKGQEIFDLGSSPSEVARRVAGAVDRLERVSGDSPSGLHQKERMWRDLERSEDLAHMKLVADAWCAAFVMKKVRSAPDPTEGVFRLLVKDPEGGDPALHREIAALAGQFQLLHPHLAFPGAFLNPPGDGVGVGFDVVLGNPPWERVKLQEKEWFAVRRPDIATAPNKAARARMIDALAEEDPPLYAEWLAALRQAEGESHLIRDSGRYPLCGRGDVNTYAVFAELMRGLIGPLGRTGVIVPSGIATDDTTKFFFRDLVERRSLASLFDFENKGIFPAVDSRQKFCLLTLAGPDRPVREAEFVFFAHDTSELTDPDRRFTLNADDFALINPNTRTCPIFRSRRDAELTKSIYRRVPVLVNDEKGEDGNPWHVSFLRMFDMSNDSHLFRTREQLEADGWTLDGNVFRRAEDEYLPLYEAKMAHQFDHRWATYRRDGSVHDVSDAEKADPAFAPLPRYWVAGKQVESRLADRWARDWLLGWRRIARATDERTFLSFAIPNHGAGDSVFLILPQHALAALLPANFGAFVFDYAARQKLGGTNANFYIVDQLPVLPPSVYADPCPWDRQQSLRDWIVARVLELTYTAADLASFARDLGYEGPPFRWDPERRVQLRAELDAAFFHLYGISRDDVDYIMDTFAIVKRKDEKAFGTYRTKRLILETYDAMSESMEAGTPYQTVLDPPPGSGAVAHRDGRVPVEGAPRGPR